MNPTQRAALKAKIEQAILPTKPKPAPAPPSPPKAAKTDPQPPKPKKKKSKYYEHSRLPDGSVFCVDFRAEQQEWHGHLHVGGGGPQFEEQSSGVFRLLMKLDQLYRKHLAKDAEVAIPTDK